MKPDDFLKNEYSYTKKSISLTRFNIDYVGKCLSGMECKSYQKVGIKEREVHKMKLDIKSEQK